MNFTKKRIRNEIKSLGLKVRGKNVFCTFSDYCSIIEYFPEAKKYFVFQLQLFEA